MECDVGYRFCHTDEELVTEFLWKKKNDVGAIVRRDIYGENRAPWQVLKGEGDDPWQVIRVWDKDSRRIKTMEKTIYVITALNKAKDTHKRIRREAGCGTWHGETGVNEIFDLSGRLIGYKKTFTFIVPADDLIFQGDSNDNCSSSNINGHWIMHEYSLAGEFKSTTAGTDEYALCKIMFDGAKSLKKSAPKTKNKKRKRDTCTDGNQGMEQGMEQRRRCVTASVASVSASAEKQQQPLMMMPQPPATTTSTNNATSVLPPPLQSFEEESLSSNFDDELSFERVMQLQPPTATSSCCFGLEDNDDIQFYIEELEQLLMPDEIEESTNCQPGKCNPGGKNWHAFSLD